MTVMNGCESYFAISYRDFFSGVFTDFCMKKVVLLHGEPYCEFMLLLTFLSLVCSCALSIC